MTIAAGRRALITGGASGFGLEIARWLIAAGARVAIADTSADEVRAAAARTNPLGRNATSEDVAGAVLWLLDDDASFITGIALDVDGGAHLGFLPGA